MRKSKMYVLVEVEVDANELPPHLAGLVTRPPLRPLQTREQLPWFASEDDRREQRRRKQRSKSKGK